MQYYQHLYTVDDNDLSLRMIYSIPPSSMILTLLKNYILISSLTTTIKQEWLWLSTIHSSELSVLLTHSAAMYLYIHLLYYGKYVLCKTVI